jgi:hypothetical protein
VSVGDDVNFGRPSNVTRVEVKEHTDQNICD